MLQGKCLKVEEKELPPRLPFNKLEDRFTEFQGLDIGRSTPKELTIPILNLWECLLDARYKMPCGQYEYFELIEDYGIRKLTYWNRSGGNFSGPYRSFLGEIKGSTEFVSISMSTYATAANPELERTALSVAIDNEEASHHALQLVGDDNLEMSGKTCSFYHNGRIGIRNLGSGRINELRKYVSRSYPIILIENRFFLGYTKL